MPPIPGEALDVYERAVLAAWDAYAELSALLKDDAFAILKELRYVTPRASAERLKAIEKDAEKRAIETARYVIPLAAFTSMVHTVSGITLHRLRRMAAAGDTPHEARARDRPHGRSRARDRPALLREGRAATSSPRRRPARSRASRGPAATATRSPREFDARLDGRVSRLVDASDRAERVVADAVRATFGLTAAELDDDEALDRVLNPARNRYRLDVLNVSYHSPMMRALQHASYTFAKRLSHTADSQDQRHRMVPASRPLMTFADTRGARLRHAAAHRGQPAGARRVRPRHAATRGPPKNRLLALGVPLEFALYVLPNAKALRIVESGPLIALLHKWTLRTCFNAQEEIYLASMDELAQVRETHPRLARHVGPPCVVRNGLISPRCTEGSHFCGVPVWNSFPQAVRRL